MKKHYRVENDCLNCGATLQGKFCHVCGQENLEIKENFGHLMNHAVGDYFHFDEKFFNTLKPLLFKPGKLTMEYMAGKRTSYLHPVKMYIFISLVFFVLLFKQSDQQLTFTRPINHKPTKADSIIAKNPKLTEEQKSNIYKLYDYTIVKKGKSYDTTYNNISSFMTHAHLDTSYQQYLITQQKLPVAKRDGFLMRLYYKKEFALNKKGLNGVDVLVEDSKHNIPKMMFLLLPLFALLLKLTFWRNKKFYVEHLIYSFHLHCFLFLFLTVVMLFQLVIPTNSTFAGLMSFIVFLLCLFYTYRSLRVVYKRSRWRTISKMTGIFLSYSVLLVICIVSVFVVTAAFEI